MDSHNNKLSKRIPSPALRCYAVIVTFNPDINKVRSLIDILQKNFINAVVVDNTIEQ